MRLGAGSAKCLGLVVGIVVSAVGISAGAAAETAAAQGPHSVKIPGNFVYVEAPNSPDRCLWGVGVEFPTVPKAISYTIDYWDGYYHAQETGSVNAPVGKTPGLVGANYLGITGGGGPPPCVSDPTQGGRFTKTPTVYANFAGAAPDTGAIEGFITNKDGNPVEGATVTAYGPSHATTTSATGGLYYMTVDKGHYRVVADDNAPKKAAVDPSYADVDVPAQGHAEADFVVQSGLQVTLDYSNSSVLGDGTSIVQGTVFTTEGGKPDPGVNLELLVDPTNPHASLTTDPKVTVCGPSGRIWPTGPNVTDLDGTDITVTTNANGQYKFSLAVGTTPGAWELEAWAQNQDGSLSTDVTASDTKTLTIQPLTPAISLSDVVTELNLLKSTPLSSQITTNPGPLATLLEGLAAKGNVSGVKLGGLSFSAGQAADGYNVVIAPADQRFEIEPNGDVKITPAVSKDLIIDPQEWSGKGLPAAIASLGSLQAVIQAGELPDIPTVGQWESGASVRGWALKPSTLTISTNALAWYGYANYPLGTWPAGYCQ